jgi:hypothetical protein
MLEIRRIRGPKEQADNEGKATLWLYAKYGVEFFPHTSLP